MARYAKFRTVYLLSAILLCMGMATNAWGAKTSPAITLSATAPVPASSVVGQPVTFTATVTPSTTLALDSYVQFFDSGNFIGVAPITGTTDGTGVGPGSFRTAVFTTAKLSQGVHGNITATYLSNADFNQVSASAVSYTVNKRSTSTAITSLNPTSVAVSAGSTVNVQVSDTASIPAGTRGSFTGITPTSGSFSAVTGHAQALMPDGKVLIIGGTNSSNAAIGTSQIYTPGVSPGAGTFAAGLPLPASAVRTGAAATPLQDGTILITGGSNDGTPSGASRRAYIYDPVAGTVTALALSGATQMAVARMNHTATLLPSGDVLITGGENGGAALTSTELFTFSSGHFGALALTLAAGRKGHTATLLSDGTTLLVGGDGANDAEIINAAQTATSSLIPTIAARSFHSANLLPDGNVVIMGGLIGSSIDNTVEFYNFSAGAFQSGIRTMDVARQGHKSTVLPDGTIFVSGGSATTAATGGLASTSYYNPPYDPQGTATISSSDGTDAVDPGSGTTKCNPMSLSGDGQPTCVGTVTPSGVNTNPHNIDAAFADLPGNHLGSSTPSSTALKVLQNITITAADDSKTYDGTSAPSNPATVKPTLTSGGPLQGTDVLCATQTFATRNAVVTTTVSSQTLVVRDTTCSGTDHTGEYNITYVAGAGTISQLALTVTAQTNSKTYDSLLTAAAVPQVTSGAVQTGDTAAFTEAYGDKNVGTGKTLTPSGIVNDGNSGANYTYSFVNDTTGVITVAHLTVTADAKSKTYDKTVFSPFTATLTGFAGTETLGTSGVAGSASFSGAATTATNAGTYTNGIVPAVGTLTATNYDFTTFNPGTLTINARALTVTAQTNTKPYDTLTTAAALPLITVGTLQGSDTANFIEAYSTKTAGTGKTLVPSGTVNDGNSGNNYTYNFVNDTTGVITAVTLTGTIGASNKIYDGLTSATITTRNLSGVLGSDNVSYVGGTATFGDKNVGAGKTVSGTGLSLSGADAANYTVNSTANTTADITPRTLTVAATAGTANKVYDATAAAPAQALTDDRVGGDLLTLTSTSTFADKNVGTGKTVSVSSIAISSGLDQGNYTVGNTTASTTGNITALAITGTVTVSNKIYDGTNGASITARNLSGVLSGDLVDYTGGTATFSNKNVGNAKTVSVNGLSLANTDAGNYTVNTTTSTTADITPLAITVTAAANSKVYDGGTTSATLPTTTALATGDTAGFVQAYGDKNVGTGKSLTPSGLVNDGNSGNNYTYTYTAAAVGDITPLAITGSITANSKVYDATTAAAIATRTLTGVLGSDDITYTGGTATFSDKNVGVGKTVSATGLSTTGLDAGNYSVNSAASATADITALAITGTVTANSKTYDGTNTATLANRSLTGVLGSDLVTYTGGTATFSDKNVGTGKTVSVTGLSLTDTDAGNYTVNTSTSTTADITALAVTVTAAADTKVYDGGTASVTVPTTTTLGTGDTAAFVQVYGDKNVGTAKTLTPSGLVNDGNSGNNYTYTYVPGAAGTITAKPITGVITASDKVYDSTSAATIVTRNLVGVVSGDAITLNGGTATFSDANVGAAKTVTGTGFTTSGTDAGNYSVASPITTTANITKRNLTVTPDPQTKIYGQTFTAYTPAAVTAAAGTGLQGPDAITVNFASGGAVGTATVGTYDITVPSVTFTTGVATNYNITLATKVAGLTVNKADLTITPNDLQKTVGLLYTFANSEFTQVGLVNSDSISGLTLSSAGAAANAPAGTYDITISNISGVGLSNYNVLPQIGHMQVGSDFSVTTLDVAPVLNAPNASFTFTAVVKPLSTTSTVIPQGKVTLTMDGATGPFSSAGYALDATGKATIASIVIPAGIHKIQADFTPGDANYKISSGSTGVTVAASLRTDSSGKPTPIPAGTTAVINASIPFNGTTFTLTNTNVSCVVTSAVTTSTANQPTCTVAPASGSYPITVSSGSAAASLKVSIQTSVIQAFAQPAPNPAHGRMLALYAFSLGVPGMVFMGLAGTNRRKLFRGKALRWLGLMLVVVLLVAAIGCGGGFSNPGNAQPVVSANASTPGNYTAVVYYTDSASQQHALVSVDFAVGQ